MKKLLALILTIAILFTFAACSTKTEEPDTDEEVVDVLTDSSATSDAQDDETEAEDEEKPNESEQNKPDSEQQQDKPSADDSSGNHQQQAPSTPDADTTTQESTLGNILLKDFNSKVDSGMDALSIAEAILTNPAIQFMGGAMPVEEGLLSGFDNYEVKGFKSGAMFAPMIGSIPFVGYIFELENSADASSFIAGLKSNANLRWNICVEADEMVTGSKGNKVFFVMCPSSLEEPSEE